MQNIQNRPEKDKASTAPTVKALSEESQSINKGTFMSNSTEVTTNRAITVPFLGAELYVVDHNSQPYAPMKPIITGMGLTWHGQHAKIKANANRWGVLELRTPSAGGLQDMLCMPLRKLPGWLSGIESGKVKNPDARAKVIQYQNECDDVLWQYWNDGIAINHRAEFAVNPGDVLTSEEAETLRLMLKSAVDRLPKDQQGAFMMKGWSKLKSHFKVTYREIPRHEYSEAVSIVARHISEWGEDGDMTGGLSLADCGDKSKVSSFLVAARKRALRHLAHIDKQISDWELVDEEPKGILPEAQQHEIVERLNRVSNLFHPGSDQFADMIGIGRALRGLHPRLGMREQGWKQLIPQIA